MVRIAMSVAARAADAAVAVKVGDKNRVDSPTARGSNLEPIPLGTLGSTHGAEGFFIGSVLLMKRLEHGGLNSVSVP